MSLLVNLNEHPIDRMVMALVWLVIGSLPAGSALAETIKIDLGPTSYRVELATTVEQRRKGLMYREQLAADQGMLLVYPRSGDHRIWMKNMRIPLRVFWIDEDFTVLSVQRLEPCTASPCPVFSTDQSTRYVLELSDHDHILKRGDKIEGLSGL